MRKRIDLEVIRSIAIIFVIINHTATNSYICNDIYNSSFAYYLYLFIASLARVAVPLFFMVSGILLIPKEETITTIVKKRIIKYVFIIVGASVFQYFWLVYSDIIDLSLESLVIYLTKLYTESVIIPYWFLYAYLALMIMLPFLRKLVKNMSSQEFKYLIILHLVFFSLCQVFEYFVNIDRINLSLPLSCETSCFYFILGYYIENYIHINKKTIYLHVISLFSVIGSTMMVYWYISQENIFLMGAQYKFTSALIIFPTVSIFVLCKNYCNFSSKILNKIISLLGSASFGIYLFESVFEAASFDIYFIVKKFLPPIFSWLIWVFFVIVISTILISFFKMLHKCIKKFKDRGTRKKRQGTALCLER